MRANDRGASYGKSVVESLIRYMGDIDDHPQTIHLPDNFPPEIGQTVMDVGIGARICPVVGLKMCQGDVTNAQPIVVPQQGQAVIDHVTAFQTEHSVDSAATMNAFNIVCRPGK